VGVSATSKTDAAELGVPALARHVLAAVAEWMGAGDGDERSGLAQAAQRQTHSRVGIAARERDTARRLGAGEHDLLWALDAGLTGRADRAVELAEGSFAAQPRERLARFLRAAVQLLNPLFAESEGRGKIQPAALGGRRLRKLRTAQPEEPAHRGGDFIRALAGTHRAESVLHGVLVQRVAIRRPQAPADLARRQQMIPADQRLRNQIEDARPALDEDLVSDDGGDALLDVLCVEHLAEQLRGAGEDRARHLIVVAARVGRGDDLLEPLCDRSELLFLETLEQGCHVGLRPLAEQLGGMAQGLAGGGDVGRAGDAQPPFVDPEQLGDGGSVLRRVAHRRRASGTDAALAANGRRPVADAQRRAARESGDGQCGAGPRIHPLQARLRVVQIADGWQRREPLPERGRLRRDRDRDPSRRDAPVVRGQRGYLAGGIELQRGRAQPPGGACAQRGRPPGRARRGGDGVFHGGAGRFPGSKHRRGVGHVRLGGMEEGARGVELS